MHFFEASLNLKSIRMTDDQLTNTDDYPQKTA